MFRTYKITNTLCLALLGLLVATQSTEAQLGGSSSRDNVGSFIQQSPSDIGLNDNAVEGQLQSQARVSNLYSKFSNANDVQREAIIQSLQGIVQQLESQRASSSSMDAVQSFPAQSYPMAAPPVQAAPVASYPAASYQAPMQPMASFDAGPIAMPAAPANNVVNNYFYGAPQAAPAPIAPAPIAPAPMPQPQSFVEFGPVFQMPQPQVISPVIKVFVPVVVPTMQAVPRHGCRLFHH